MRKVFVGREAAIYTPARSLIGGETRKEGEKKKREEETKKN